MVLRAASTKQGYDGIVAHLRQSIETSLDAASRGNQQRARAWQQFMLEPTGTEQDGQSTIQSADVNSMITAVCAQMVISFSTDAVVTLEAESAEDEEAAAAESRAVNKVAIQDNGGFSVMLGGVQNALMYRNGYLKVWWDSDVDRSTMTIPGVSEELLPIAMDTTDDATGQPDPTLKKRLVSYNPEKQVARIEVTKTVKSLTVDAVANDRFFMTPDWDRMSLHNCPLTGEVHYKTRNDLVRMGVPQAVVDDLPATVRNSGSESNGRRRKGQVVDPIVKAMEICRVFEAYAWLSFDEKDDTAYLYRCWLSEAAGSEDWLLDPDPVSRVPYCAGTAFPIANRHHGEALSDKLSSIQSGKSELLRQWIDNVKNCSFGRFGVVAGQVEAADILAPKAGGPVRMKQINSITPIPVLDVGPSIAAALQMFDKMRTERGGAAVDMVGSEEQLAQDTAHGTERVYASKELLVSYMTRNLAESMIRGMFLLAHSELRDGQNGPISLKMNGAWTQSDPASWKPRSYCNVKMGYSMGERTQISATLFAAIQLYQAALASGLEGQLVTLDGLYKLITDWMTVNMIDNPESYLVDPASEEAKAAGETKAQQSKQQAQDTADQAAKIAALPEQIASAMAKYKSDQETQFKYFNATLQAQVDQSNAERAGVIDFAKARSEAADLRSSNAAGNRDPKGGADGKPPKGKGRGSSEPGRAKPASSRK
jgi:hypothetical protein